MNKQWNPKGRALRHCKTRITADGWKQQIRAKSEFRNQKSNPRADAKKNSAANFAGILQGWRQISQESSQAQTLSTPPTTPHPTSPHYPHSVTSQNPEPNIIVISPNIAYPSPHSHTHSSPRHTPVQHDTCPCPPSPGPTLSPLTRGTDTDDRKFSFFFFPVQSRGTEPSAAVQGGHLLCR